MIKVKVKYHDDDYMTTRINATEAEAREYYKVGEWYNIGDGPRDLYKQVKSVDLIAE
jgi:hypothetical protein